MSTLQLEVVKTRMQLQGELVIRESLGHIPVYRNAFDAFFKIWRDEGFRGIQAGLLPGLMYQVLLHSVIVRSLRFTGRSFERGYLDNASIDSIQYTLQHSYIQYIYTIYNIDIYTL